MSSVFSIIGVSIILVTKPFESVMDFFECNLLAENINYDFPYPIPTNRDSIIRTKSVSERLSGTGANNMSIWYSVNFIHPNTIRISLASPAPYSNTASDNFTVQVVIIFIDRDAKNLIPQFNFLTYSSSYCNGNFCFSSKFNVNIANYGNDFNKKCILGFTDLDDVNNNRPFFIYDLDPASGVVNGN